MAGPSCFTSQRFYTGMHHRAGIHGRTGARVRETQCKIIGLSVDPVTSHGKWAADIEETQGHKVNYPMIGDPELKIAKLYDMLPADAGTTSEGRTAANNATVRRCSSWVRTRRSS